MDDIHKICIGLVHCFARNRITRIIFTELPTDHAPYHDTLRPVLVKTNTGRLQCDVIRDDRIRPLPAGPGLFEDVCLPIGIKYGCLEYAAPGLSVEITAQIEMLREAYGIEPGEVDLPTFPLFALFDPALGMTAFVADRVTARRYLGAAWRYTVQRSDGSVVDVDLAGGPATTPLDVGDACTVVVDAGHPLHRLPA